VVAALQAQAERNIARYGLVDAGADTDALASAREQRAAEGTVR
jgi:hypothetical protein